MVDGVILLVDAAEGPMPQTKFVTGKALALGLKPIVVVNKIDRPDARPAEVLDEVFELFLNLEANDEQLDFPTLYASGRAGYAGLTDDVREGDLTPLFETIVSHVPRPRVDAGPFRMLATLLDRDPFLGRILTGRIESGRLDDRTCRSRRSTSTATSSRKAARPRSSPSAASSACRSRAPKRARSSPSPASSRRPSPTPSPIPSVAAPLHARPIDPPTLAMSFSVNDSPFAGPRRRQGAEPGHPRAPGARGRGQCRDPRHHGGRQRQLRGRRPRRAPARRAHRDPAPRRLRAVDQPPARPVPRRAPSGREEPYETVVVDVDDEFSGTVIDKMALRKAEMTDMRPSGGGKTRLTFSAPSRGLIGYHGEFLSDTRGTGIMNRLFERYGPYKGPIQGRQNGVLISMEQGPAVAYALNALEERGVLFVSPGEMLYEGMVIGENAKPQDLEVNPLEVQAADQLPRLAAPRTKASA